MHKDKQIGTKPPHPLTPKVAAVLDKYAHHDNITNYAFHGIRNQLQVRVLLMQEFGYLPDCAACPTVWTKRGATPMSYEELKAYEGERVKQVPSTDGYLSAHDVCFDMHAMKTIVNKLKRSGWQIAINKDVNRCVTGYTLKNKKANTKKAKTPMLAGNGV